MSRPPGAPSPDSDPSYKPSPCNLYVNSLPKEITDDKLVQIFGTFGDIESARVMIDLTTRISKGYGFVKFRNQDAARNAAQAMNGFQMGNNILTVKPANESVTGSTSSNNIYIKGLPVIVTSDMLRMECSKFGSVSELRILADFATGISRGQALVRFDDVASAALAIEHLDNKPFPVPGNVKNLIVKYADSEDEKTDRKAKVKKKFAATRFNPYQNAPPPAYPAPVYPPYYAYTPAPDLQAVPYPAAFTYAAPPPAMPPMEPAHAPPAHMYSSHPPPPGAVDASPYSNGVPGMAPAAPARRPPAQPVSYDSTQDPNVYIYHLPPETDDAHLYQRFGKYGAILSIKIARDPAGICKGYGFIRFSNMPSAIAAIESENGQRVGNKVLSVSLAKQKGSF